MVGANDVKMEQAVEQTEIKELRELQGVHDLIMNKLRGHLTYGYDSAKIALPVLEEAARLLADARIRNKTISDFGKRLYKDFASFRGGAQAKFLTADEKRIILTTMNVSSHLQNLFDNLEFIISIVKRGDVSSVELRLQSFLSELRGLIQTVRQQYLLEKQLDAALAR